MGARFYAQSMGGGSFAYVIDREAQGANVVGNFDNYAAARDAAALLQRAQWARERGSYDVAKGPAEVEILRILESRVHLWCDVNGPQAIWKFTER